MTNKHDPPRRTRDTRVNQAVARAVAAAYVDPPDRPEPVTIAAFAQVMTGEALLRRARNGQRPQPAED